jgi:hypothetical protein
MNETQDSNNRERSPSLLEIGVLVHVFGSGEGVAAAVVVGLLCISREGVSFFSFSFFFIPCSCMADESQMSLLGGGGVKDERRASGI